MRIVAAILLLIILTLGAILGMLALVVLGTPDLPPDAPSQSVVPDDDDPS